MYVASGKLNQISLRKVTSHDRRYPWGASFHDSWTEAHAAIVARREAELIKAQNRVAQAQRWLKPGRARPGQGQGNAATGVPGMTQNEWIEVTEEPRPRTAAGGSKRPPVVNFYAGRARPRGHRPSAAELGDLVAQSVRARHRAGFRETTDPAPGREEELTMALPLSLLQWIRKTPCASPAAWPNSQPRIQRR